MSGHIATKHRLQCINTVAEFQELLDSYVLSGEEKLIMKRIYLDKKNLGYIADELGYSLSTIKRKHQHIISRINLQ